MPNTRLRSTLQALCAVAGAWAAVAAAQPATVSTPRGAAVRIVAELPAGPGPFPAIVLAPGQGYHMGLPALVQTAQALVDSGHAVLRFDWAYHDAQPRGQPSADLSAELEDLQAVLAHARTLPRIDAARLSVGGKSLGSVVAWRALAADLRLRGAVLLTPVCSRQRPGEATATPQGELNYPGLARETRPVLLVAGDRDPLCAAPQLLAWAATAPATPLRVVLVGGNHGFQQPMLPPAEAEAALAANLRAVAAAAAAFATELRQAPAAATSAATAR